MRDCVIVGGSFAGLAAARELRGRDVVVVDRSPIGAHQTSACALPVALASWLRIDDAILHADARMRIRIGDARWTVELPEPFCTIDYEAACGLLAAQSDAEFIRGRIVGREGDAAIDADGGRHVGRHLIDASGWRRVLDADGPTAGRDPLLVTGTEDHVPTAAGDEEAGAFDFAFDRRVVRAGYAWSFPAGDHARVGVGTFAREPLPPAMDALRAIEAVGPARQRHGGAIACVPRDPVADGVLFAGDAAGHALPLTLEGIRPAAYFGAAAGRLVGAALDGRIPTAEAHRRYRALHDSHRYGYRRLLRAQRLVRLVPDAAKRLTLRRWLGPASATPQPFRMTRYLDVLRAERLGSLP